MACQSELVEDLYALPSILQAQTESVVCTLLHCQSLHDKNQSVTYRAEIASYLAMTGFYKTLSSRTTVRDPVQNAKFYDTHVRTGFLVITRNDTGFY
ncbi:hypothetical protein MUGA111182_11090 [Mucilaginibacter galii]|uniref:Uncharacterized protein n=1 Tax=Mucilaginibacter galii TaxID=2005073 RepID=A0A917JA06_9SPHI|nr:hypothetical protein GCM10011425_18840 [Mucilaginibacter galii]